MPGAEDKLADQVSDVLTALVKGQWLKGAGSLRQIAVRASPRHGATTAIFFEANLSLRLFVKFSLQDVGREHQGYKTLQPCKAYSGHLIAPVLIGDEPLFILPFQEASTLHDVVCRPSAHRKLILAIYSDFLQESEHLYKETLSSHTSREFAASLKSRISSRLERLDSILGVPFSSLEIVINGKSHGGFGGWIDKFYRLLDPLPPIHHCTIHGDEHAKNLLIFDAALERYTPNGWVIIDYTNATSTGDWAYAIAKMSFWWDFYHVLELAKSNAKLRTSLKSRVSLNRNTLSLSYDPTVLAASSVPVCKTLASRTEKFANRMATLLDEDETWKRRMRATKFAVVFGSVPLNYKSSPFAIPIMLDMCRTYIGVP
jgi:hypothetical protein